MLPAFLAGAAPLLKGAGSLLGGAAIMGAAPGMIDSAVDFADMVMPAGYELTNRYRNQGRMIRMGRDMAMPAAFDFAVGDASEQMLNRALKRNRAFANTGLGRRFGSSRTDALEEADFMDFVQRAYGPRLHGIGASETPSFAEYAARHGIDIRPHYMR